MKQSQLFDHISVEMTQLLTIPNIETYLKLIKVFGLAPFTVENRKSVTKPTDVVFSLLTIAICFAFFWTVIENEEMLATGKSIIVDKGNFATYIFSLFVDIISIAMSFLFRHHIWKVVTTLIGVDRILKRLRLPENEKRIGQVYCIAMMVTVVLFVPMISFVYLAHPVVVKAALYIYSGLYYLFCNQTVAVLLILIYSRMNSITKCLQNCSKRRNEGFDMKNDLSDAEYFTAMLKIYSDLMVALESINLSFGLSMMCEIGLLFFYTMFSVFMTYKDVVEGTVDKITVVSISFAAGFLIVPLTTIYCASLLEKEVKQILKVCDDIISRSDDQIGVSILISMTARLRRNPPKFSCGLFDFDVKLAFGVRTGSTHWLTLAMNFSLSDARFSAHQHHHPHAV